MGRSPGNAGGRVVGRGVHVRPRRWTASSTPPSGRVWSGGGGGGGLAGSRASTGGAREERHGKRIRQRLLEEGLWFGCAWQANICSHAGGDGPIRSASRRDREKLSTGHRQNEHTCAVWRVSTRSLTASIASTWSPSPTTKGFHRAAEQCRVSQPTLSAQVQHIEAALGVRVFERTRRGVVVTPVGEDILGHARRVLGQVQGARRRGRARRAIPLHGTLRLGVIPTIARVPPAAYLAGLRQGVPAPADDPA